MWLSDDDVDELASGAALLASGGGGDTRAMALAARAALAEHGPVRLLDPRRMDPDALVVSVAIVGATSVMLERLPSGAECDAAVRALEQHLGTRAAALQGLEAGGLNALVPVMTASRLGLPLVDADGMGRAFPRLDQTTFAAAGILAAPVALTDPRGNVVLVQAVSNADVEHLVRGALPALGGWAGSAQYPMTASQSARNAILGTISVTRQLGRAFQLAQRHHRHTDRSDVLSPYGLQHVASGEVIEVHQRRGSRLGAITVAATGEPGRTLRVEFADEYLLVLDDGVPVAAVPDVICLLDAVRWTPVHTEQSRSGQRVDIVSLPAPDAWGRNNATHLVATAGFGITDAPPANP